MENTGMLNNDAELLCLKERCRKIKKRIINSCAVQEELIKILDSQVPKLASTLDISMKIISAFNQNENKVRKSKHSRWSFDSNLGDNISEGGDSCLETKNVFSRFENGTKPDNGCDLDDRFEIPNKGNSISLGISQCLHGTPDEYRPPGLSVGNPGFRGLPVYQIPAMPPPPPPPAPPPPGLVPVKPRTEEDDMKEIEALIKRKSVREIQKCKADEEFYDLIHRPTARETAIASKFKSKGDAQLKKFCEFITKEDCRRNLSCIMACEKVHFRRIISPHTDISLGDCTYLDNCRRIKFCKYVHYELDSVPDTETGTMTTVTQAKKPLPAEYCSQVELGEPQWIRCDIRTFRMDVLGQFGVIMADPPWDIHMELPYGTMTDDEVKNLNVPMLQNEGLIFLWVTGRAMELGRECLKIWGYKRVEELIWVKVNQLQRLIITGRTGHWLNHSKEHCLVGIKGDPELNRNIDTDVLVSEIREVSRKPDEIYAMMERMSPGTRKLELFARMHNTHPGWLSLGNQLDGVRVVDEGLRARFTSAYPDVEVQP